MNDAPWSMRIVANWLARCGLAVDDARVAELGAGVETLRANAFAGV